MRIAIATLGCKVNQFESASIEGELRTRGYEIVDYREDPDICIINTCTVTSRSDQQSRQLIRRAANRGARVIATGCYAQLRPEELSKMEGVIYVTGNSGKGHIASKIDLLLDSKVPVMDIAIPASPVKSGYYYSSRSRALLKIQDGCNHSCSYCSVPLARGRSRSLQTGEALRAALDFWKKGYMEIVLTGINIGAYGYDLNPPSTLSDLIRQINRSIPDVRIRLSSIEPQEFNDDLLSFVGDGLICRHLHIPLQSGSDKILRMMNRGYDSLFYRNLIQRILSLNPDISIGTDVIVGFPGEREEEFQQTIELLEELPFSYVHAFQYSKRPGTKAELLTNEVDPYTKKKRVGIIKEMALEKKRQYISKFLGKVLEVIIEGNNRIDGFSSGISDNYIKVIVDGKNLKPGSRLMVKAFSLYDSTLMCKPL